MTKNAEALLASLRAFIDADDVTDAAHAAMLDTLLDAPADVVDALTHDDRELLTTVCLAMSFCPVHLIDYAICFDDDDAECRAVRVIHPNHDT